MTFQKTFALFAAVAHAGSTFSKKKNKVEEATKAEVTKVLEEAVAQHVGEKLKPHLENLGAQQGQINGMKEDIKSLSEDIKSLSEEFKKLSKSTKLFAEYAKQFAQSNPNPKSANLPLEYKPRLMLKQDKDQNKNEITFNIDPENSAWFSKFADSNRSFNQNPTVFFHDNEPIQRASIEELSANTDKLALEYKVEDGKDMNIIDADLSETETDTLPESKIESEDKLDEEYSTLLTKNILQTVLKNADEDSTDNTQDVEETEYDPFVSAADRDFTKKHFEEQKAKELKRIKDEKEKSEKEEIDFLEEWKKNAKNKQEIMKKIAGECEDNGVHLSGSRLIAN